MAKSLKDQGWALLGCLALFGLVGLFAYAPIFAVDCFWHLKLGQVIVEQRAIPDQDLFSAVHPERAYVQFQWLWDVLAYGAERLLGLRGVRLFSVLTMLGSFLLLGSAAVRAFQSRALAFAFCALALVLFEDRFQTRPSATALGFTAAMLPVWLGITRASSRAELAFVYVLSCLWSNIHGGEALLAGLGMAALALGDFIVSRLSSDSARQEAAIRSMRLLAATVLGTLSSPTFLSGLRDWSWAIKPQLASGNKEWLPTYTMLENGFTASFVLIALGPEPAYRRVHLGAASAATRGARECIATRRVALVWGHVRAVRACGAQRVPVHRAAGLHAATRSGKGPYCAPPHARGQRGRVPVAGRLRRSRAARLRGPD